MGAPNGASVASPRSRTAIGKPPPPPSWGQALRCSLARQRAHCADGSGWTDERGSLFGLRRAGADLRDQRRRYRHPRDELRSRWDNLPAHKVSGAKQAIEAKGAAFINLPPYSPDLNPIENAFAKLKALLRKAAARTVDELWDIIGKAIETFTPSECLNYFKAAGYGSV